MRFTRTRRVRARGRGVLLRRKRVGVVAFVRRRVLARRLGLAARECGEKLVPLHGRRSAAATRTRAPKKDPFASSIAIATPEFDVARERRARGTTFRGRRRGEKGVVVRTGKRRESGRRRRNSASDRAPRLRRRPSSARRPRPISEKNLIRYCSSSIANGDLGRAVKDALRVCKWKTRVAFLILLLGFVFQTFADHAFVDASQIDASDSNPEPDTSARV